MVITTFLIVARRSAFDDEALRQALQATFDRRRIPLPADVPLALTPLFTEDRVKQTQWAAFIRKSRLAAPGLTLNSLIPLLRAFLLPPAQAAAQGLPHPATWTAGGPWRPHSYSSGDG